MKKNYFFLLSMLMLITDALVAQPTRPSAPIIYNSTGCTSAISETCTGSSTVVTNFTGGILRLGSPQTLPAVYSYYNIATVSGKQINATITIDEQVNVDMSPGMFTMDDDAALDQSGSSITHFFAPRISSKNVLTTTDERGYVQFTIKFYLEDNTTGEQYPQDYSSVPPLGGLEGLNYIHYDIDGGAVGTGGWFRETGVIKKVPGTVINADLGTELISYSYSDGSNSWNGFAGAVSERTGVSRCAETVAAGKFSYPQTQVTFRMGYDYYYNGTALNTQSTRQYGSRFGCFSFPHQSTLPVRLLSFSGAIKNNSAVLNWITENETNFSGYDIERSTNGINFYSLALKSIQAVGMGRYNYKHTDNLMAEAGNDFYYRLKMIDKDGRYTYSNIIVIRKDQKTTGISIAPNPVLNNQVATIRIETTKPCFTYFNIIDMSGTIVLKQQSNVEEGNNSIHINGLDKLKPGIYWIQMNNGGEIINSKFSIIK
jgi:hypothetical protein